MEATPEAIVDFLSQRAQSWWDEHQAPYLLAFVAPELNSKGIDYRAVIGEERLKGFVERHVADGQFRLVAHPLQYAKVGIVPVGVAFEYETTVEEANPGNRKEPREKPDDTLIRFLRALEHLPASELDKIVLPTSVLVRLVGRR